MQQWAKCILVLAWKMTMVEAQCPSFTCPGMPKCYLIYPSKGDWKYKDPEGDIHDADGNVYTSPNCYKFIRVKKGIRSCNDAQRECEKVGGNITVINGIEEYEQLTENVIHILRHGTDSTFNVHVQNLQRNGISKGCAKITVEDGNFKNSVDIKNTACATTHTVDTIVCESTDVNTEICPKPATSMPISSTKKTVTTSPPVTQTKRWSTVDQSFVTDEATAEYTSVVFTHPSKENQSKMEAGSKLWMVAAVSSIVVITIVIILLFIRRRQKRTKPRYLVGPNQHLPSIGQPIENGNSGRATVSYSNGVVVHEYSTVEDHNQDLGEAYHILEATDMPSQSGTLVENDAYAVPYYDDAPANDGMQDQEYAYDMINAADMHSRSPEQNGLGGDVYAVPNKNSKGRKEQDVDEAYDALNAADMQPASEQRRGEPNDAFDDALYVNVTTHGRSLQDDGEAYDSLNAADMEPVSKQRRGEPSDAFDDEPYVNANARRLDDMRGYGGNKEISDDAYDVPYKESTTCDSIRDHDVYNSLNGAEVHSKSGKHNVGSGNEYGKLNAADLPPKDNMYSYVATEVGCGIVTMPHAEDQTYDKLQRNTELGGALTADHYYGSIQ